MNRTPQQPAFIDDLEVKRGPSEAFPGRTNVAIRGPSPDAVQNAIQDLADEFNCVQFTLPSRLPDGSWMVMGQGWNEI